MVEFNPMRAFFRFLLVMAFAGASAQAQPPLISSPNFDDLPSTITIPTFDLGDWNSSGDMPPMSPIFPGDDLRVVYACQAQITDGVRRKDRRQGEFKRYQIATFQFSKDTHWIEATDLDWFGKNFYSHHRIVDTTSPAPFSVNGAWMSLSPESSSTARLTLNVKQHLSQDLQVDGIQSFIIPLSSGRFEHSVSAPVVNTRDRNFPRMTLRIICHQQN